MVLCSMCISVNFIVEGRVCLFAIRFSVGQHTRALYGVVSIC